MYSTAGVLVCLQKLWFDTDRMLVRETACRRDKNLCFDIDGMLVGTPRLREVPASDRRRVRSLICRMLPMPFSPRRKTRDFQCGSQCLADREAGQKAQRTGAPRRRRRLDSTRCHCLVQSLGLCLCRGRVPPPSALWCSPALCPHMKEECDSQAAM